MGEMLRIVIAEDAAVIRAGLAEVLTDRGHEIVAAVGDAEALQAAVAEHKPDVAIVDVRMPPDHTDEGLRAAIAIRRDHPGTGILVFSQYVETTRMPVPGWSRRIAIAARSPSSVWSGGIRTSTIATSGLCSATAARSASASPTAATTSCPRSVRISVSPALITAASSAMTTRSISTISRTSWRASGVGRQFHGHHRGPAGRAVDVDAAVDGADAFGEPAQAPARNRGRAAVAVIGDPDPQQPGDVHGFEGSVPRAAVLADVGEQFGRGEVGDRLDGRRRPFGDVRD